MRLSTILLVASATSYASAQNTTWTNTTTDATTTDYESDPTATPSLTGGDDVDYQIQDDAVVTQDLPSDNGFAAYRFATLISGETDCLKSYWAASKDSAQQCSDDPNAEPTAASNDTSTASFLGACLCAQVTYNDNVPPRTIDFDTYVQCCDNIGRTNVREGFTAACQNGDLTITTPVRGTSSPVADTGNSTATDTATVEVTTGAAAAGFSAAPFMGVITLAFMVGAALL